MILSVSLSVDVNFFFQTKLFLLSVEFFLFVFFCFVLFFSICHRASFSPFVSRFLQCFPFLSFKSVFAKSTKLQL